MEKLVDKLLSLDLDYEKIKKEVKKNLKKESGYPCTKKDLSKGERVSHFDEVERLKRAIGLQVSIITMIDSREKNCRKIVDQILASIQVLKEIAHYILYRHSEVCADEDTWQGNHEEYEKEVELIYRYFPKIFGNPDKILKDYLK